MGSTNKTSNYELSQFLGSDSPKWLTDYNADMQKIDAGIAAVKTQADATDLTVAGHTSTISNLSSEVGDQTTAMQQIRGDVTGLQGTVNTITSLIGNGEPTTTDKTLIGAINELKGDIDELAPSGDLKANDVSYDNTTSGLTATNVQAAIDEIASAHSMAPDYDSSKVTPLASAATNTYTATADGWVYAYANAASGGNNVTVDVNGVRVLNSTNSTTVFFPVSKGDVVTCSGTMSSSSHFIPVKGS